MRSAAYGQKQSLSLSRGGMSLMAKTLISARAQLIIGILLIGSLILKSAVEWYYTWYMPRAADPATGKTLPLTVFYNRVVFVTPSEQELSVVTSDLWVIAVIVFICAYVIEQKRKGNL